MKVPIHEKYMLTTAEAAEYFSIGTKQIRKILLEHPEIAIWYGNKWIAGRLWLNPGSCGMARWGEEVTMARLILRDGRIEQVEKLTFPDDSSHIPG